MISNPTQFTSSRSSVSELPNQFTESHRISTGSSSPRIQPSPLFMKGTTRLTISTFGYEISKRSRTLSINTQIFSSGGNSSNEDSGTATPQCVLDIVGRTCKFQVRVNDFNFKSARATATVSRIIDADIENEKKDGKRQRLN
ncbi:hypothetical protein Bca52824_001305 [Brassica carinata]|uniref:Uncharacterized protein n=1 Tax=Brassica carinata TaxID=52824 RepID=A0A8X7WJ53_BRACI|nr:hypothetical protein Bca52824_001305 [Brassica carinata]